MPMIPDKDEEEENNKNDDSDIRESIKQYFDGKDEMVAREPEFTGDFGEENDDVESRISQNQPQN